MERTRVTTQFGFQKGKSTVDCIFAFSSIISKPSKTLNLGEKLYCVFIDYEKAFDKINRSFLWQKLLAENVSSKFVEALRSMYSVVKSCVRYSSSNSRFFTSNNGLKQGDPSSPLLFMLFINDIIHNIHAGLEKIFTIDDLELFLMLYADDAVVFAKSPESLQSILNDIELYCNTWGLKINTLCYVMLCYVMLCYVMLCYVMLCYVMLCYVMLCYVMLCYVMLCYVMLCYVMLCYVMLCYVMLSIKFNIHISYFLFSTNFYINHNHSRRFRPGMTQTNDPDICIHIPYFCRNFKLQAGNPNQPLKRNIKV